MEHVLTCEEFSLSLVFLWLNPSSAQLVTVPSE